MELPGKLCEPLDIIEAERRVKKRLGDILKKKNMMRGALERENVGAYFPCMTHKHAL